MVVSARAKSIWIERPHGRTMVVAGPGKYREERDFPDEDALQDYQVDLATRLTDAGWFLWGFDRERRHTATAASSLAIHRTEGREGRTGPPSAVAG